MLINDPHTVRKSSLLDRNLDRARNGPRWLENPKIAALFVEALLHGERVRGSYDLFAWAVIPNHVHIVLKPHEKPSEVVRWMKTASAARARENPVTAGLALRAEDWPWSSASKYTGGETAGAPKC
jgi:Transposase IS200 like